MGQSRIGAARLGGKRAADIPAITSESKPRQGDSVGSTTGCQASSV